MTIDPNTNLPQLPEGYFWRVKSEHLLQIMQVEIPGEWGEWRWHDGNQTAGRKLHLSFSRLVDVEVRTRTQRMPRKQKTGPFWFRQTETVLTEVPVHEYRERTVRKERPVYTERFGTYRIKHEDYKDTVNLPDEYIPGYAGYGQTLYNQTKQVIRTREVEVLDVPDPITRENIYDRAELALAKWQNRQDLLGDYPPKKLES